MIFTSDKIYGCKQCGLALSEHNTTGFCTHFCEDKFNGVTKVPVHYERSTHISADPVKRAPHEIQRVRVRPETVETPRLTDLQKFLARAKLNPHDKISE